LAFGSVFHHPRRDFASLQRLPPARTRRYGRLARNGDCPYESHESGQKKK
jgi:hypothetical protein